MSSSLKLYITVLHRAARVSRDRITLAQTVFFILIKSISIVHQFRVVQYLNFNRIVPSVSFLIRDLLKVYQTGSPAKIYFVTHPLPPFSSCLTPPFPCTVSYQLNPSLIFKYVFVPQFPFMLWSQNSHHTLNFKPTSSLQLPCHCLPD